MVLKVKGKSSSLKLPDSKSVKGKLKGSRGKGVSRERMANFISTSQCNLSLQGLFLSKMKEAASSLADSTVKKEITNKIDGLSNLNSKQLNMLDSLNKDLKSSTQNEI